MISIWGFLYFSILCILLSRKIIYGIPGAEKRQGLPYLTERERIYAIGFTYQTSSQPSLQSVLQSPAQRLYPPKSANPQLPQLVTMTFSPLSSTISISGFRYSSVPPRFFQQVLHFLFLSALIGRSVLPKPLSPLTAPCCSPVYRNQLRSAAVSPNP